MKNHEEFKAAIFQKAERFEARRKARNKKILETPCQMRGKPVIIRGSKTN